MRELKERFDFWVNNGFNYEESLKRQNIQHEEVVKLRKIISKNPNIPKSTHDRLLLLFINATKGCIDEAAKHIQKFYELKKTSPELFWNRNPESEELQFSFKIQQMARLPITPDNCYLFIHRVSDANPKMYNYDDVFKMFMMMAEHAVITNGPREGSIFISDWTGIRFGHLLRPSISSIRKSFEFIQYASPIKMKAVHIINSSPLVQILFSMCKPFMSSEFNELIHVHPNDLNYEEFFDKHVPRSCMPADYGGDLPLVEELHWKNVENLISYKEYFHLEEHHLKQNFDEFVEECGDDE